MPGAVHATCPTKKTMGRTSLAATTSNNPRSPNPAQASLVAQDLHIPTPTAEQRRDASGQLPTPTNNAPLEPPKTYCHRYILLSSLSAPSFSRRPKNASEFQFMNPATVPSCFLCSRPGFQPLTSPITDAFRTSRTPPCHTTPWPRYDRAPLTPRLPQRPRPGSGSRVSKAQTNPRAAI